MKINNLFRYKGGKILDIKKELTEYWFNYQYYLEKLKDVKLQKNHLDESYERMKSITSKTKIEIPAEVYQKIVNSQLAEEEALLLILNKKKQIENEINNLDQPYKIVLYFRYIRLNSFGEIANSLNYSTKRIYQLHQEGLNELQAKRTNSAEENIELANISKH